MSKNTKLVVAMIGKQLSGRQLAIEAKLHPVSLSRILNHRAKPKPSTAQRIAIALDASPETLALGTHRTGGDQ